MVRFGRGLLIILACLKSKLTVEYHGRELQDGLWDVFAVQQSHIERVINTQGL